MVSLFAKARSMPFSRVKIEGKRPAAPAIPFTQISAFDEEITFFMPSMPSAFSFVDGY